MVALRFLLKILLINGLTLIFGLLVVEVLLRVFWPVEDPFLPLKRKEFTDYAFIESQFKPNLKLKLSSTEGMPGLGGTTTFSINNLGMRGPHWGKHVQDTDARSIFIIGGSTSECLYLDDSTSLSSRLQFYLNKKNSARKHYVFAAAKSGDFSRDHIAMLCQRVVHLKPDAVVLFCGINDLRRLASINFDPLIYPVYPKEPFKGNFKKDLGLFLSYSQLYRRVYYVMNAVDKPVDEIRLESNYKDKIEHLNRLKISAQYPVIDTSWFKSNLLSFIATCRVNAIEPFLMTQATTWKYEQMESYQWMRYVNDLRYSREVMQKQMDIVNNIIRNVAKNQEVRLIDLDSHEYLSKDMFYDDCHFNSMGADFTAKMMADIMNESID